MPRPIEALTFRRGPGRGNRLLAVGLPERIEIHGLWMVWEANDGVFVQHTDRVVFLALDRVAGVALSDERCRIACEREKCCLVVELDPTLSPVGTEIAGELAGIGVDAVTVRQDRGCVAFIGSSAAEFRMPVGARDASPMPFSVGVGVIWVDGCNIMRIRGDGKPSVAGSLPSPPVRFISGPHGACAFDVDGVLWCAAPRGRPLLVGPYDIDSCRFNASGEQMVAFGPEGAVLIDTESAVLIARSESAAWPVGFAGIPLLLDDDKGVLHTLDGSIHEAGFSPSAVCVDGDRVYGPGGTAWDTLSGAQIWPHAPLGAEHLLMVGNRVVQITDRISVFDRQGQLVSENPLPTHLYEEGELIDVEATVEGLRCVCEYGWFDVSLSGERLSSHGRESTEPTTVDGRIQDGHTPDHIGILNDGSVQSSNGRRLVWTEDGMLAQLTVSPAD